MVEKRWHTRTVEQFSSWYQSYFEAGIMRERQQKGKERAFSLTFCHRAWRTRGSSEGWGLGRLRSEKDAGCCFPRMRGGIRLAADSGTAAGSKCKCPNRTQRSRSSGAPRRSPRTRRRGGRPGTTTGSSGSTAPALWSRFASRRRCGSRTRAYRSAKSRRRSPQRARTCGRGPLRRSWEIGGGLGKRRGLG